MPRFALAVVAVVGGCVGPDPDVVSLEGAPAFWVAEDTHALTVRLVDADGEPIRADGLAVFAASDPAAVFPTEPVAVAGGEATVDVTLVTAGEQTLTVSFDDLTGRAVTIVEPAAAARIDPTSLRVSTLAGEAFTVGFSVRDPAGNVVIATGDAVVTSTDPLYDGPDTLRFDAGLAALDGARLWTVGSHDLLVTLVVGAETLTAAVDVETAAPDYTIVLASLPGSLSGPPGSSWDLTVGVRDPFGRVVDLDGEATVTSTDPRYEGPARVGFADGIATLDGATLWTPGDHAVRVALPQPWGEVTGVIDVEVRDPNWVLTVVAAPPDGRVAAWVGESVSFDLEIRDAGDGYALATSLSGDASVTSSDPNGHAPASVRFVDGAARLDGVRFGTTGGQTLTVLLPQPAGPFSGEVAVDVGATPFALEVSPAPPVGGLPVVAGAATSLAFAVRDLRTGLVATELDGEATVTSTDPRYAGPVALRFDGGVAVADDVRLLTAGDGSVTVTLPFGSVDLHRTVPFDVRVPPWTLETHPAHDGGLSVPAGAEVPLQLSVRDPNGAIVDVSGVAAVTSTDPQLDGPDVVSFVRGVAASDALRFAFQTVGAHTLTVSLPVPWGALTADVEVLVYPPTWYVQVASLPTTGVFRGAPDEGWSLDLSVRDPYAGDALVPFSGEATVTCTDPGYDGPAAVTFVDGRAALDVGFGAPGLHVVTVSLAVPWGDVDVVVPFALAVPGTPALYLDVFAMPAPGYLSGPVGGAHHLDLSVVDALSGAVVGLSGTATVQSSDPRYDGPSEVSFALGWATLDLRMATPGSQTLTVTLPVAGGALIRTVRFDVYVPTWTLDVAPSPPGVVHPVPAFAEHPLTLTVRDPNRVVAAGLTGAATVTSTDPRYDGPSTLSFVRGVAALDVRLSTPGPQAVTVALPVPWGEIREILRFDVDVPTLRIDLDGHPDGHTFVGPAGTPLTVDLVVVDDDGVVVEALSGLATVEGSDPRLEAPRTVDFTAGRASLPVRLGAEGTQTVTVALPVPWGELSRVIPFDVVNPVYTLVVDNLPEGGVLTGPAGRAHPLALSVRERGSVVSSVQGVAAVTSTDPAYTGPSTVAFDGGRAAFSARLGTVGAQTVTVALPLPWGDLAVDIDVAVVAVDGPSLSLVASPAVAQPEQLVSITAEVRDAQGQLMNLSGPLQVEVGPSVYLVESPIELVDGTASFHAVFFVAGTETIRAVFDPFDAEVEVQVVPGPLNNLVFVEVPSVVRAGVPVDAVVAAEDAFGNRVSSASGDLELTSTDPGLGGVTTGVLAGGEGRISGVVFATEGVHDVQVVLLPAGLHFGFTTVEVVTAGPIGVADALELDEDTSIEVPVATLLANDEPEDPLDVLTFAGVLEISEDEGPQLDVVVQDGVLTVTPAADFNGDAWFTYGVSDGAVSRETSVRVAVVPVADPPFVTAKDTVVCDGVALLDVEAAATSARSPEDVAVRFLDLPDGSALSGGTVVDGVPTVAALDLLGLTLTLSPGTPTPVTVTVEAVATEPGNGDATTTTASFEVDTDCPP